MADFATLKTQMLDRIMKTTDALKKEFSGLRTGRASVNLLDSVVVDAYGAATPINQVGTVSVPEPRMLTVSVWDKGLLKNVEKAIRDAGLGLNPMNDGIHIRVPLPPLSEERRVELTKIAAKYTEGARVAIRTTRRDTLDELKKLEKEHLISEDDEKRYGAEVQKIVDDSIKALDDMLEAKEVEIKQV